LPLRLEPRPAPSPLWLWASPLLALGLTLAAGAALLLALGHAPGRALWALFVSPLETTYGLAEIALKATPLALIATGLALGFRAGVWNIGAEGQLTLGAIAATGVGLAFWGTGFPLQLPLLLAAGIAGGMLWAAIPAVLRTRLGVSEILVSLMLTYVATLLLSWLVYGPWKDPQGFNFPQTRLLDAEAALPTLVPGTRLHVGALAVLAVVAAGSFALNRTLWGFALRTVGTAPNAARWAGFAERRLVGATLLASGGLAGLAGAFEVAGPLGQLVPVISPGYGFTAIIVAFLGRLQPWAILAASLVLALSFIGGENAQVTAGLPRAVTGVFQGLLLFFLLACDLLVRFRLAPARAATRAA
jgi:simple sugar transport system permease protein